MDKTFYTIPPDKAFVDIVAEGLWREAGGDVFKLSQSLILLPTRRAVLHLREAFLRRTQMKASLLPRMQPLGDIDEDEFYFSSGQDLNPTISPAIAPLKRHMLLTQLVAARDKEMPLDQAAQLAAALAQLLDQVQIERKDFSKLDTLVEDKDLAQHWQETVQFLQIVTAAWPKMLDAEGAIDPAKRRNLVLEAQAALWRAAPPSYPVIAAGSTGSMPATADLLDVIAGLPRGTVILPGLDQTLDEEAWQAIGETHPQFGMKELLEKCGVKRGDVQVWGASSSSPRVGLLQESMRPAEVTEEWRHLDEKKIPPKAFEGLTRIALDHPQEEAQVIALLMREALETPDKTIALVTSDRSLAERVSLMLQRWDITANDSAGASLSTLPIGAFLSDVLAAASPGADAIDYLSLLKHPMAACGLSTAECRIQARHIEIHVWRNERPEKSGWLGTFKKQFHPIASTWNKRLALSVRLDAHIKLAEQCATSDTEMGATRLWKDEAGEATTEWLSDWEQAADQFPPLTGPEYSGLFQELLRGVIVRPSYGQHPRLSILGPLEARLIHADLIILGGLNEGSWPPEAAIDPWMSRPMKKAFGLPLPERRIGLSAHDFVQLASASEVVLTRSKRAGNAPTVPSRFLLQLETVLRALGYSDDQTDALAPQQPWQNWAQMLDEPTGPPQPCAAPAPKPPAAMRPKQLSVTEIGSWRRNPYAIYAKHVLGLRKLDPLEAAIDASDRGMMVHEALDQFIKKFPDILPPNPLPELLKIGTIIFSAYDEHPEVKAFWWPRFERIAGWFIEQEQERRAQGIKTLQSEAKGKMAFGALTLKGRADRIDQLPDGHLAIIDYKTGGVPTKKDVIAGYEPQLPLLALMAGEGAFGNARDQAVTEIAYWKLSGGREPAEASPINANVDKLAQEARKGLEQLIATFADPETPYQAVPKPQLQPRFDDYAHLARLAEWGRTGEGE